MRKLKKTKVKLLVTLLSFVLLFCGTMGSSLAWLLDKTDDVTNTFTPSKIKVGLKETYSTFKMIPGHTIDKDPVVTVDADSEDCWVFVKVTESADLDDYISYNIDSNNWTPLGEDNYPGVYYTYSLDIEKDRNIKVLGEGSYYFEFDNGTPDDESDDINLNFEWNPQQVLTKPQVTETMMEAVMNGNAKPTLTFTAYACQLWKTNEVADDPDTAEDESSSAQFTPLEAWNLVKPTT